MGLGFGNPVQGSRALGLFVRLGVMYTDAPRFDMQGEGLIAPTANQDEDIEEGLQDFKWYPVLNLGFSVKIR
ncbi:MAG: hypothetical protein U5K31_02790 [Balneolaceae bacterium]|nr:hypothetical protein [Balneolaceae bacterium]